MLTFYSRVIKSFIRVLIGELLTIKYEVAIGNIKLFIIDLKHARYFFLNHY